MKMINAYKVVRHESDGVGLRESDVELGLFSFKADADFIAAHLGGSCTTQLVLITIYDSVLEYDTAEVTRLADSALAKLTDRELEALRIRGLGPSKQQ